MDDQPDISAHSLNARVLRFRSQSDSEPPAVLARDLMAVGRYGDARGVLILAQDLGDAAAPEPSLWLLEGEAWMAEGDYGRALACYMRVARIAPSDPSGFRAMGRALLERNDLLRAEKALERCLILDPDDEEALALQASVEAAREASPGDTGDTGDADALLEIEVDLEEADALVAAAPPEPPRVLDDEPYAEPLQPSASSAPARPSVVGDTSPGLGLAPSGAPLAGMPPIPAPIGAGSQSAVPALSAEDALTASGQLSSPGTLAAAELSPSTAGAIEAMTPLSTGTLGGHTPSSAGTVEAVSPSSAGMLSAPSMESSPGTLSAMGTLSAPTPLTSAGLESSPGMLSSPGTMASVGELGASTAAAAIWVESAPVADGFDDETSGVNELPQEPQADAEPLARGPVDLDPDAIEEIADSMDEAFAVYERESTRPPASDDLAPPAIPAEALRQVGDLATEGLPELSVEALVADELEDVQEAGAEAIWVPTPMDLDAASPALGLRLDAEISGSNVITKAPAPGGASPWITGAVMIALAGAGYLGLQQWQQHGEQWVAQARTTLAGLELPVMPWEAPKADIKAAPKATAPRVAAKADAKPVALDTAPSTAQTAPTPTTPVVAEVAEPAAVKQAAVAEPEVAAAPAEAAAADLSLPTDRASARASLSALRAAAAGSNDATTLVRYATALYLTDHVDRAAGVYDSALAADSTHLGALVGRAEVHLRAERPQDALQLLERARQLTDHRLMPQMRARLLGLLGRGYLQRGQAGDRSAARRVLMKAAGLPEADAATHFWLGESLAGRQTSRAAEAYQRYLQLAPHGPYATRAKRALGPLL